MFFKCLLDGGFQQWKLRILNSCGIWTEHSRNSYGYVYGYDGTTFSRSWAQRFRAQIWTRTPTSSTPQIILVEIGKKWNIPGNQARYRRYELCFFQRSVSNNSNNYNKNIRFWTDKEFLWWREKSSQKMLFLKSSRVGIIRWNNLSKKLLGNMFFGWCNRIVKKKLNISLHNVRSVYLGWIWVCSHLQSLLGIDALFAGFEQKTFQKTY